MVYPVCFASFLWMLSASVHHNRMNCPKGLLTQRESHQNLWYFLSREPDNQSNNQPVNQSQIKIFHSPLIVTVSKLDCAHGSCYHQSDVRPTSTRRMSIYHDCCQLQPIHQRVKYRLCMPDCDINNHISNKGKYAQLISNSAKLITKMTRHFTYLLQCIVNGRSW